MVMSLQPAVHFSNLIKAKRGLYSVAEMGLAWTNVDGEKRLVRGYLTFSGSELPDRDIKLDYGQLILERHRLPAVDAFQMIEAASSGSVSPTGFSGTIPKSQLQLSPWGWNEFVGLPNPVGSPRFVQWPSRTFVVAREDNAAVPVWNGPIVNTRLPLVSDPQKSIDEFLGMALSGYAGFYGIAVFLPDYRARFIRAVISDESVTAEFEAGTLPTKQLMIRAAVDSVEVDSLLKTDWEKGVSVLSGKEVGERLEFFLFDREQDQLIDWVQLRSGSVSYPEEVAFTSPYAQIQRLIRLGEGIQQEFKQELGNAERLTQSIVSFANTQGGTIFLGIDDSGRPFKTNLSGAEETIERKIRNDCDPYIRVGFESVEYQDTPLLLVKVPEGTEKPYVHRPRGSVLVRGGRTNFSATSEEIKRLAERPKPPGFT